MRGATRRKRLSGELIEGVVENLSDDGRGIVREEGRTVFVRGGIAGERIQYKVKRVCRRYDEAEVVEVIEPSPDRTQPICDHFDVCGGCRVQHMTPESQIAYKGDVLKSHFKHFGKVALEEPWPPLVGPTSHYRYKARLGARYVPQKGRVLVGFREAHSSKLADMRHCPVLHAKIHGLIDTLSTLIGSFDVPNDIPQIEVAMSDDDGALIFRHMSPLPEKDRLLLQAFGQAHALQIYAQPGGPDSLVLLYPEVAQPLRYALPDFGVDFEFKPLDFTQVNPAMNRLMVAQAIEKLNPTGDETVLDLFCGLGNFTLPLSMRTKHVTGVEGDSTLVARAISNAKRQGLEDKLSFHTANLMTDFGSAEWASKTYDMVLLDPPRSGAEHILRQIGRFKARKVLYVSCDPATLARDAGILVNEQGYRLRGAGVMDMFPHTSHVESMALFELP